MAEHQDRDGLEAARLLGAYLRHVEDRVKRERESEERIVLVLPDAEVADRKRQAKRRRARPQAGVKKRTDRGA